MAFQYPVPAETKAIFERFGKNSRNVGLVFERFIGFGANWSLEPTRDSNPKMENLRLISQLRPDLDLLAAHAERWKAMTIACGAKTFFAATDWHFVTGLGNKGALEVGFRFHRLYGIPIIPGSGLKGLTAAYAKLVEKISEDDFNKIFGNQDQAGSAIFFDALPYGPPKLALDVMNPHYPDYYQNPENPPAPADWLKPVPIPFLTVGRECIFQFAVGGRGKEGEAAQALAAQWLEKALQKIGAGAKTSSGYGCFSSVTQQEIERAKQQLTQMASVSPSQPAKAAPATPPSRKKETKPKSTPKAPVFSTPPAPTPTTIAKGDKLRAHVLRVESSTQYLVKLQDKGRTEELSCEVRRELGENDLIEVRIETIDKGKNQIKKVGFVRIIKSAG